MLGTTRQGHRHTPSLDRGIGDGVRYLGRDSLAMGQAQPRLCGRRSRHCRKSCFQSLCSRQRRTAAPSPPLAGRLLGPTASDPRYPSNRTNDRSLRSPVSFLLRAAAATDWTLDVQAQLIATLHSLMSFNAGLQARASRSSGARAVAAACAEHGTMSLCGRISRVAWESHVPFSCAASRARSGAGGAGGRKE